MRFFSNQNRIYLISQTCDIDAIFLKLIKHVHHVRSDSTKISKYHSRILLQTNLNIFLMFHEYNS